MVFHSIRAWWARVGTKSTPPARGRRRQSQFSVRSVAGQIFVLQFVIVLLLITVAVVALAVQAQSGIMKAARAQSLTGAQTFANAPGTLAAIKSGDPTAQLQPRAEQARKESGLDYIVVFSPQGIRWTHPNPDLIGKHILGDPHEEGLAGEAYSGTFDSPVGKAVVTVAPVLDADDRVAGLVGVGIRVDSVNDRVARQLPLLLASAGGGLMLATAGSALVSRRLRRQTHGLEPAELRRMYEHHDAVLHAAREGLLVVGGDGKLLLANDESRTLLDLPEDAEQRHVADLGLHPEMAELLLSGRTATDEVHVAGDRLLAVNVRPTVPYGGPSGSVVTLRDTTELRAISGKAAIAERRLRLLYDAMTEIGTSLDVVRTAEELTRFSVPRFANFATVDLIESIFEGGEPEGTEMRRAAVAGIRDDHPLYAVGKLIDFGSATPQAVGLATGEPVLEAGLPALNGWRWHEPETGRRIVDYGIHSMIVVPLRARGILMGVASFWRSEKAAFEQADVSIAEELVARAAVAIDNARRYTREHTMAVALQRSLLPQAVPEQSAVEAAHYYLPAQAGVGGDWFDVIQLPGARVAMVVGDVVGHGLHASVTMGRLRTAVHNFSALDLPPDELLTRLDELVSRIDSDEIREDNGAGISGATCLYAIYDPVAGQVTAARAGHVGPASILPDGSVSFPDIPVSPPLGLGAGLPVETAEFPLPEGSRIVMYTDGLIENRGRDIDTGLKELRGALAGTAGATPEATCAAVLDAMLPTHPSDDVALLVARTHMLDADRVAEWDVPSDAAAVALVRKACRSTLHAWGLEEIGYATELIISELITNALRYGSQPIRVRLLLDRCLVCEVSDGSSTSPHMRRAATTDEGGRGLFLVAQFAERWGTRYTSRGKVIWTEQPLHDRTGEQGPELGELLLEQWADEVL